MKSTMEAIEDYIVYLKNEQKLFVTIHSCGDALTHVTGRLAPYNVHANPYCVFIKSVSDRWNECICRQSGIYEHIRTHGDEIFFGSCYAGVGEYVVPVCDGHTICGFISVGGYTGSLSKALHAAEKHQLPKETAVKQYQTYLSAEIPPPSLISTLLVPLRYMMLAAYREKTPADTAGHASLAAAALTFLHRNFAADVTLDDAAAVCGVSRRTLSTVFRQTTGYTVRHYIEKLRMEKACSLLGENTLSVTEIAFLCGYSDANYFSARFAHIVGAPPTRYMRQKMAEPGAKAIE